MQCVKTGCEVYLAEYGEWVRGDAHASGDFLFFRLSGSFLERAPDRVHYQIRKIDEWFDRRTTSPGRPSTLVARAAHVDDYGYDGALPALLGLV